MNLIRDNDEKYYWFFLFILTLLLRSASFYTPVLDVDETQFAGFAHVLMDGGLPYVDSLDTKPLGIYLFYWFVFALFGRTNMVAVHVVTACISFATAYFLYLVFAQWERKREGRWAALLFVVFSTTFVPKYIATSINSVMVFFLVLSVYFMARSARSGVLLDSALSGLILGLALLFKYTAGIQCVLFFCFSGIWMLLSRVDRSRAQVLKTFIVHNAIFALAFVLPFVLHGVVLWHIGVWPDFVNWSLAGSGAYIAQGGSTIAFWQSLLIRFGGYVLATMFVWIYSVRGFQKSLLRHPLYLLLMCWFVLTLVPVCLGGRFYPHYFIPLLPSLCGLAAYGVNRVKVSKTVVVLLIVLPATLFWTLRLDYRTFLKHFPDDAIYEQQSVGERIKVMSQPGDTLFVWGFATGIYFSSGLKPASRFLWTDLLTGRTPGPYYARRNQDQEGTYANEGAWRVFWQDVEKSHPTFFVDTSPANIHDYRRFPISRYPALQAFIQKNYEKVDNVEGVGVYRARE
ncbi:MAG: hypothetical protein ACD_62C00603G0002 [uncultured bacterium]|nr:MAG: hypothetical protein ACD_62C00603G0002 [uncultured bacterium]HLD43905.1 glycosyltransferase family 39 protein [bacterium]